MKKNKKPQAPKLGGNIELARAMQGLRQSSAATPHRNRSRYDRNDHRRNKQKGVWE